MGRTTLTAARLRPSCVPWHAINARCTAKDWASGLIAFLPLVTAELVLGIPRVLRHMVDRTSSWGSNRAWGVAIPMAAVWALSGAIQGRGSALSCVFVVFLLAGVLGACIEQHGARLQARCPRACSSLPPRVAALATVVYTGAKLLCFTDILVWVALAAPLDLRWVDDAFWYGPDGQAYDWWAIAISVVLVIGFAGTREEAFYRLVPRLRDFGVYLACLAGVLLTGTLLLRWTLARCVRLTRARWCDSPASGPDWPGHEVPDVPSDEEPHGWRLYWHLLRQRCRGGHR